jgi:hypothetical protein
MNFAQPKNQYPFRFHTVGATQRGRPGFGIYAIGVFVKGRATTRGRPNEINPNEINPNEINPNKINPNKINPNKINPNKDQSQQRSIQPN